METNTQTSIPFNGCNTGLGNSILALWNLHFLHLPFHRDALNVDIYQIFKTKLNENAHLTAAAILSCKGKKGGGAFNNWHSTNIYVPCLTSYRNPPL